MNESNIAPVPNFQKAAMPFPAALSWKFLARTGVVTVSSAILIGGFAAGYLGLEWGARYAFTACWATAFFAATAMIFRHLMFTEQKSKGMLFAGIKVGLLVLMWWVNFFMWPVPQDGSPAQRMQTLAIFAGVTTPFIVLVFRVLGFVMEFQRGRATVQNNLTSTSGGVNS